MDDIFDLDKEEKGQDKQPKRKRKERKKRKRVKKTKRKGTIFLIPTSESLIQTLAFPEEMPLPEVEKKFASDRFTPVEYDVKQVGQSEGLLWYLGIASTYSNAVRADTVVPKAYAEMWTALQSKEHTGYVMLIDVEDGYVHIAIGSEDVIMYNFFASDIKNFTVDNFKNQLEAVIQKFRMRTFSSVEIEKTIVIGNIPPQYFAVMRNPEAVIVNPAEYAGDLNLNPKRQFRRKFSGRRLIYSLPNIGRKVLAEAVAFLLALSWAFPVSAGINYVSKLYKDNNLKIQENIREIRTARNKIETVINQLKEEENLVENWNKAAQSIRKIDYVKFSKLIESGPNVQSFGIDGDKVVIVLKASSPDTVDAFMQKLMASGFFTSFEAPVRKNGTAIYVLHGTLKGPQGGEK